MPGIRRPFSGPNGSKNFIPDNGEIVLTRNGAARIIRIDITGPHGQMYHRIINRDLAQNVTDIEFWVQDAI